MQVRSLVDERLQAIETLRRAEQRNLLAHNEIMVGNYYIRRGAYLAAVNRGRHVVEYTLRLNNPGRFLMPPSRVEAMYAPSIRAQLPVPAMTVWGG